ncbi:unnamed protein product [Meganyctiphanes norvegica]|uniref:EB domain-containing protein n=1 Tax=Meganyctiphanes norvegica TaxID=48144 RepID=A0AAV2PZ00_MEGNR
MVSAAFIGSLSFLVTVGAATTSDSNLRGATCQYQNECRVGLGEVCDVWGSGRCECPAGSVRALDRTCHLVRLIGQACVWDLQCRAHDQYALCHSQRCECTSGIRETDGKCKQFSSFNSGITNIWQSIGTPSPTPSATKDKSTNKTIGAGSIAIGSLLVIFLCILLFLMVLHIKLRHRRLDELRRILEANPTPIIRSRSYSEPGLRDAAPPSYNTLGPPSYEQAVGHPGTLSSSLPSELRAETCRVNIDPAGIGASTPISIPGSQDNSHRRHSTPSAPPLYQDMDIEGIYANQEVIDQVSRSQR